MSEPMMVCPSCGREQAQGLLCWEDSEALLTMFAAIPQLVEELQVAISKQAKLGSSGPGGLARERSPINFGALAVRDALMVEAAVWAGEDIDDIRKHPQVKDIVRGVGCAVKDAYRAIDRLADRQYLGQCLAEEDGAVCHAELWVRPGATRAKCPGCETTHDVSLRRASLLKRAEDIICTVKEASRYMGEVGHVVVTEASIRGYLHRGRIGYRTGTMIRLGDLLAVVLDESERKSA